MDESEGSSVTPPLKTPKRQSHFDASRIQEFEEIEQTHDLLKFREIGQEEFDKYIEYNITVKASVNPTH